jgi:hypothetical protein
MTPTTNFPAQTVEEIVTRAGRPDFDRWASKWPDAGTARTRSGFAAAFNTDQPPANGSPTPPTVNRIGCC